MLQRGLVLTARWPVRAVVDAFLASGWEGCRRLTAAEAAAKVPSVRPEVVRAALYSPHDLRVESRTAIPKVAAYLGAKYGVEFRRQTQVLDVAPPAIATTRGTVRAEAAIVCPGDDFTSLFPERIASYNVTRCKLHMLRVRPAKPVKFETAVMSDLGLGRYLGYSELPAATPLKARLDRDLKAARDNGVHLIVTQSADGSLVVGDSHHYAVTPDPFAPSEVDDIILEEFDRVLDLPGRVVTERWVGHRVGARSLADDNKPSDSVRIVIVTSGCGASTAFGIGESDRRAGRRLAGSDAACSASRRIASASSICARSSPTAGSTSVRCPSSS